VSTLTFAGPNDRNVRVPRLLVGADSPWGEATPFCRGGLNGRWCCATHEVAEFSTGAHMSAHVDGPADWLPCAIGWRCFACGDVHGFREQTR
jgi:hypothetical protein